MTAKLATVHGIVRTLPRSIPQTDGTWIGGFQLDEVRADGSTVVYSVLLEGMADKLPFGTGDRLTISGLADRTPHLTFLHATGVQHRIAA